MRLVGCLLNTSRCYYHLVVAPFPMTILAIYIVLKIFYIIIFYKKMIGLLVGWVIVYRPRDDCNYIGP